VSELLVIGYPDMQTAAQAAATVHELPVAFDGPDLAEIGTCSGLGADGVVAALRDRPLEVAFLGFAPGFAYLVGLPDALARCGRRATPRPFVPAGSVAVAGGFAAIYPVPSPGGWNLIGSTETRLFDPSRAPFALLRPGDRVVLSPSARPARRRARALEAPAPGAPPERPCAPSEPQPASGSRPAVPRPEQHGLARQQLTGRRLATSDLARIIVVRAGAGTLVQDRGRIGLASLGIARGGTADPLGAERANALVGNAPDAAVLEVFGGGLALRFTDQRYVAVAGAASLSLDGLEVAEESVISVSTGQLLELHYVRTGSRATIAVGGGVVTPMLLGSRSTDTLAWVGAGLLVAGDELNLGTPGRPRAHRAPALRAGPIDTIVTRAAREPVELRAIPGPDRFEDEMLKWLGQSRWRVDASCNRVGVRLELDGDLEPETGRSPTSISSRAMVTGAIQLPPDRQPIVLGPDHATTGGYPVIATVITADRSAIGQLRAGDGVVISFVDLASAQLALNEALHQARTVPGWYPTIAG
jgi:biotin-dependent carboxylase-like uncharacterized protein